jgi:AraC family transcriptional regulator of adaptative response/methylated-DNA-[protein]-cysteine methyltransferase
MRVWNALTRLAPGDTVSYSELARRIRAPGSTRAVASAVASNHIAVLVPCHRVVGRDGSLTGYKWGLARKKKLLAREKPRADSKT